MKCDMANALKFYTPKISDKLECANSAEQNQTAPGAVLWARSTLFAILLSILRNNCVKKLNLP